MRAAKENRQTKAGVRLFIGSRPIAGVQTVIPSAIKSFCSTSERGELPNGSNVRAADLRGALEAARTAGAT
jgi:hypothetical protein